MTRCTGAASCTTLVDMTTSHPNVLPFTPRLSLGRQARTTVSPDAVQAARLAWAIRAERESKAQWLVALRRLKQVLGPHQA